MATISEVARLFGIDPDTVNDWVIGSTKRCQEPLFCFCWIAPLSTITNPLGLHCTPSCPIAGPRITFISS